MAHNHRVGMSRYNVMASTKHYVGDGGTDKGKNEGNTIIDYENLEKIHMLPYLDCISKGVCTLEWNQIAFSSLSPNRYSKREARGIVIQIGKHLIGFTVLMDQTTEVFALFVTSFTYLEFLGEVSMSRIDDAVERILRVKFAAKLFEYPMSDRSLLDIVGCKQHRELAREAVRKALVLLKNGKDPRKPFLPLNKNAKKILVAGKHADDLGYQCGGWAATWEGTRTTILDAVKEAIGNNNTEFVYEENPTTESLSGQDFSYAIVAVGEAPYVESAGDNSDLTIPFKGEELLKQVASEFGIPTLAILISGRPLVLETSVVEASDGLVAGWLPGTEGNGITDVIFGDYDFHGKLPVSWFKSVDQFPMDPQQNSYDPLFPLGYGLKCKN
uniref:Glycoside hydrolase family 3 C-terminal domain-containing protein n=1 Tax=Lactuca sativa TaxID=4236 RepID=A0A9R1VGI0_LACSA|nr:hypothetical protein LSAT_V11C500291450 [Lactuca sativa]